MSPTPTVSAGREQCKDERNPGTAIAFVCIRSQRLGPLFATRCWGLVTPLLLGPSLTRYWGRRDMRKYMAMLAATPAFRLSVPPGIGNVTLVTRSLISAGNP